jgi:hypothetical protein
VQISWDAAGISMLSAKEVDDRVVLYYTNIIAYALDIRDHCALISVANYRPQPHLELFTIL